MKSLASCKIPVILTGLAAMLVLSPACKAQSEITPDHFDGTDSWATMAKKVAAPKLQRTLMALQANHRQESAASSRLATNRQSSTVPHKGAPVILSRRKATALKAEKKTRVTKETNPFICQIETTLRRSPWSSPRRFSVSWLYL